MRLATITISVALLSAAATVTAADSPDNSSQNVQVMRNITLMPLAFTESRGQWDKQVLFRADLGDSYDSRLPLETVAVANQRFSRRAWTKERNHNKELPMKFTR